MELPPQRITEILLGYWQDICANGYLPRETDIEPMELAYIWPSCFLVRRTGKEYEYIYLGQDLIDAYGDERQARSVCTRLVFPAGESLTDLFDQVVQTVEPLEKDGEFTNVQGMVIKYRSIFLPLADENGEVGFILGGMKWKSF